MLIISFFHSITWYIWVTALNSNPIKISLFSVFLFVPFCFVFSQWTWKLKAQVLSWVTAVQFLLFFFLTKYALDSWNVSELHLGPIASSLAPPMSNKLTQIHYMILYLNFKLNMKLSYSKNFRNCKENILRKRGKAA